MPADAQLLKFLKGEVILKESTCESAAYWIHTGEVEVFQNRNGRRTILARLGPGQIFGELGLILERPRTASVCAVEDTVVERLIPEAFSDFLMRDPKRLLPFLQVLFERFRTMGPECLTKAGMIVQTGASDSFSPAPGPARTTQKIPVLSGLTPQAKESLAKDRNSLAIRSLPFRLGRRTGRLFVDIASYNDLYLDDKTPFQVSRSHCSVNQAVTGEYFVQDRGSTLGTFVNGRLIGGSEPVFEAPLDRERNEIILGSVESPFRFAVELRDSF